MTELDRGVESAVAIAVLGVLAAIFILTLVL
jgi:hypothetical protein